MAGADASTRGRAVGSLLAGEIAEAAITTAATVVTTLALNDPLGDDGWAVHLNTIILGLTIANTVLVALVTFVSPGSKWEQLRGAALALESEIWKFRTRSGPYARGSSFSDAMSDRPAELHLQVMALSICALFKPNHLWIWRTDGDMRYVCRQ